MSNRKKKMHALFAANLWYLIVDGHAPDTKYSRKEVSRQLKLAGKKWSDI